MARDDDSRFLALNGCARYTYEDRRNVPEVRCLLLSQPLALEQLGEIADASDGSVEVLDSRTDDSNTYLYVDITIRFEGVERSEDGIPIRAREGFCITIGEQFPYSSPSVLTRHTRFSDYPHVQWSRSLCLYQSSSDWHPEDGMYGFVSRLDHWMRDAAIETS